MNLQSKAFCSEGQIKNKSDSAQGKVIKRERWETKTAQQALLNFKAAFLYISGIWAMLLNSILISLVFVYSLGRRRPENWKYKAGKKLQKSKTVSWSSSVHSHGPFSCKKNNHAPFLFQSTGQKWCQVVWGLKEWIGAEGTSHPTQVMGRQRPLTLCSEVSMASALCHQAALSLSPFDIWTL